MTSRPLALLVVLGTSVLVLGAPPAAQADTLTGRVVDETGAPVVGARVTLTVEGKILSAVSSETGGFELRGLEPVVYELRVEKPGFYALVNREFRPPRGAGIAELVLNHQQVYEERMNVEYSAPAAIDPQEISATEDLSAAEISDLPYPAARDFRNGLPTIPSVVQDNTGRIHLNGGAQDQVLYRLNGFNITDPYTSSLQNAIPVDAVREINVLSSRYSAEFGKNSAGVLSVESGGGDDRFRYRATNLVPGFRWEDGIELHKWSPRGYLSGPWRRGRAWFLNATDFFYLPERVYELPHGANRNIRWQVNNLLRNHVVVGKKHVVSSTLLVNHSQEDHAGLSPRDPVETTRERRERDYFLTFKDQQYLPFGALLEVGLAVDRLRTRYQPYGAKTYRTGPTGQTGNHFEESLGISRRWQAITNLVLPPVSWRGRHEWKIGGGLDWIGMERRVERRPSEVLRADGTLWRRTFFPGPTEFGKGNFEQNLYVQDRWTLAEPFLLELGLRQDWNEALEQRVWAPRLAFSFLPFRNGRTKLLTGWGLFYETASLESLTLALDQPRDELLFTEDGSAIFAGPIPIRFQVPQRLKLPRSGNFSVSVEQGLPGSLLLGASYLRRRTTDGFGFLDPPLSGVFAMSNRRRDRYDALEIRAERDFGRGYRLLAAYTRSAARSNGVQNLSVTNPVFGRLEEGPLDWDAPHRAVSWARLPLSPRNVLLYFLQWRSGYPFSVFSERTGLVGPPNSHRFPSYFSLNVELEHRFRLRKYQLALLGGFTNITNRKNPHVVGNFVEYPDYLRFSGTERRALIVRIRLVGRN